MANKSKKSNTRDVIRQDLIDQLDRNGAAKKYYVDLVDDYMHMWDTKTGLTKDIKTRGTKVKVHTATSENLRTNDSVPDLLKVNAQMLKILDCLGIKPTSDDGGSGGGGPGDEEM